MAYEHYADLASMTPKLHDGLSRIRSADHCTVVFAEAELRRKKARARGDQVQEREQQRVRDDARALYIKGPNARDGQTRPIADLDLPTGLELHKAPPVVSKRWVHLEVHFTLSAPCYSKDDHPFHVLDNPVRKDRVFGVPFVAAASWKGLLRWACRMEAGLLEHLEKHGGRMRGWHEPDWIVHLFGNERGEGEEFSRSALQFFPTWFDRIGFEVINPHSRETKAGTQPIVYEVVPAGTQGRLRLLYTPAPGRDGPPGTMPKFIRAIENLLTVYGFSAKRTAGWGLAEIRQCTLSFLPKGRFEQWAGGHDVGEYRPPVEAVAKLLDEDGRPIPILLGEEGQVISRTQFRKLGAAKPCTKQELDALRTWHEAHGQEHQRRLKGRVGEEVARVVKREFSSLKQLCAVFERGAE